MQRIRRRTVLAAAGGLAVGAMTGCSASTKGHAKNLTVWGAVPAENGPTALIDAYRQRTGVTVTYEYFPNTDEGNVKLDTALQGNAAMDLFFSYTLPRMAPRVQAGRALDLSDRVKADKDLAFLLEGEPKTPMIDGKLYGLPTSQEPVFLVYNLNHVEAAGITIDPNWTTDEFESAARALTSGGRAGAYTYPETPRQVLGPNYYYTADGKASNFGNPLFREHMERWLALQDDGAVFSQKKILAQKLQTYQPSAFLSGEFTIWRSSPINFRYIGDRDKYPHDFRVGFAHEPRPTNAEPWNTGAGLNNWIMINPKTSNVDAAWELARFWATEGAKYMLSGGKVPISAASIDESVINGLLGEKREELYDLASATSVLSATAKYPLDTITTAAAQIQKIVSDARTSCLLGDISVGAYIDKIKTESDEAIQRAGR